MSKGLISSLRKEFCGYGPKKLANDLMAGLTVTAVALPLALAFGVSSGANAASGLITAIIAGLIIGGLGGARYQISGPTGAMTAILSGLSVQFGIQGVFFAGMLSGILLVIAALLNAGTLVSFIPSPVITGFTSGIAIIIALGQIDSFFGTRSEGITVIEKLSSYGRLGFPIDWHAVMFGVLVIAIMLIWPRKWNAKFPSSLAGIIIALILQMIVGFDVKEVGAIPRTILLEDRLTFSNMPVREMSQFILPAVSIALLSMVESLLCGASAGKMTGDKLDAKQELLAQGIGNTIIPFFGGVPATAAIARTSVAIKSGCATRLTSVFHSVGLLLSMFILAPFMSRIPLSALAGVLMVTAWRMNEWNEIRNMFRNRVKTSIAQFLITMLATVVFDLTAAIAIGVLFSMFIFVIRSRRIEIEADDSEEGIRCIYMTGALFFGTQGKVLSYVDSMDDDYDTCLFTFRGVQSIDQSALEEFEEAVEIIRNRGKRVCICGLNSQVKSMFTRFSVDDRIGEENIFNNVTESVERIQHA